MVYYINILSTLKELIKKEINLKTKSRIEKGVYFFGNHYIKEHLSFSSNEFSIIFSFQLFHNGNDANVINLFQKGKEMVLWLRKLLKKMLA